MHGINNLTTTEEEGPKAHRLRGLLPSIAITAFLATACTEVAEKVHNVMDTEERGNFYGWQFGGGIYEDPTSLNNVAEWTSMTGGMITTTPNDIEWLLGNFRTVGLKLIPLLAEWDDYTTPDGNFDFELWEQKILTYQDLDLSSFIEDETFAGVVLLDDASNFADGGPDSIILDEMARIVREVLHLQDEQRFPLIVSDDATNRVFKHEDHPFEYLNTVYVQISDTKAGGDLYGFIDEQKNAMAELGLDGHVIWGVNGVDWELTNTDGTCQSGYFGSIEGRCLITPQELEWVSAVIEEAGGPNEGTALWKISSDWPFSVFYTEDDYRDAFKYLAAAAD